MFAGINLKDMEVNTRDGDQFERVKNKEYKKIIFQKIMMDYIKTNIDFLIKKMIDDDLPLYLMKELVEIFLTSLNKFFAPFDLSYIGLSYSGLIKAIDERLEIEDLHRKHKTIADQIKEVLNETILKFNDKDLNPKILSLLNAFKDEIGLHINEKFKDLNPIDYVELIKSFESKLSSVKDVNNLNKYDEVI